MSKLLRVFINVDLRAGHEGLSILAKKHNIQTSKITPGNYVVFINTRRDKLKMYAADEVVAYLRLPAGRRISMYVIKELPHVFNGVTINYDRALAIAIDKQLLKSGKSLVVL